MTDFAQQRENMVENQVRPNGVTDIRIASRMRTVARELFVPKQRRSLAYVDEPVAIGAGRYLMPSMQFAKLVQLAEIEGGNSALVIGAGLGYGVAIVAGLADSVVAIDQDEDMVAAANELLADQGIDNAAVIEAALNEGAANQGPYDVILIEGAVEEVPAGLFDQLAEGGRLVAFLSGEGSGKAVLYTKVDGIIGQRLGFDAVVPSLPGFEKEQTFAL